MKILVAAPGYDSREKHEVNIFALDQAKALRDAGHDVRFAAVDTRSIRHARPLGFRSYMLDGIGVYYGAIPCGALPLALPALAGRMAASGIWRIVAKDGWKPDIIHQHFGFDLRRAARDTAVPFVYTEHRSAINCLLPPAAQKALKEEYEKTDALLCVSQMLEKSIFSNTGLRAKVVSNIVDTQNFSTAGKACVQNDVFHFVASGFLIERKGYDLLLHSVGELRRRGYSLALTVFGDGAERTNLQNLAETEGVSDCVDFRGHCSRKEMAEAYAQADAFVLASRRETFGVVYIEAMASGLPVIATRCGGPEDFVTEENGILIPVDDVAALTDAMEHMMLHRSEYDSAAIATSTRERFAPEKIAAQLTEIYTAVLEKY